jgi:uncharacterized protein YjbI with pentapeptide repeats
MTHPETMAWTSRQARWQGPQGETFLQKVLAQRFSLTPSQRMQALDNDSLVADLAGIVLKERDLRDGMLQGVDMRGADCRAAHLVNVLIQYAKAGGADFEGAQLDDIFIWKSDLAEASFAEAQLHKVTFEESRLDEVSFAYASLHGVRFHSLDLSECNFEGARFTDCNLFDVRIDERYRARLEGMARGACRLSRVTWVAPSFVS